MKSAFSGLCVAAICAMTAAAFANPPLYRSLAPWIFGIVTFVILGGLIAWGIYCWSGKTIRLREWNAQEGRVITALLIWIALALFMACLRFVPHIVPKTPQIGPPTNSAAPIKP
jgi:xanthine/uracil permease